MDELVTDDRIAGLLQLSLEEALKEGRSTAVDLGLRQRQHPERFHPSGKTVGDPRQGQHIGRASEEKSTRAIILVDRLLDREEQIRCALDLIDDGSIQAPDEPGWISLRSFEHGLVV